MTLFLGNEEWVDVGSVGEFSFSSSYYTLVSCFAERYTRRYSPNTNRRLIILSSPVQRREGWTGGGESVEEGVGM